MTADANLDHEHSWWFPTDGDRDEPEPLRCEADHIDGGVCLRVLRPDDTCPGEKDHA